ncbi:hypothetical protein CHS0354_035185 [Potamilus streckersoni]|uniref:Uncharacterized protein n=1 Tax=Potamilus streckersoni TaxID=2493646 RepID=A0AAE0W2W7_9BIVA|nr:hypothetical protein CHS0354_035185 [Potamilus streckersoni]
MSQHNDKKNVLIQKKITPKTKGIKPNIANNKRENENEPQYCTKSGSNEKDNILPEPEKIPHFTPMQDKRLWSPLLTNNASTVIAKHLATKPTSAYINESVTLVAVATVISAHFGTKMCKLPLTTPLHIELLSILHNGKRK